SDPQGIGGGDDKHLSTRNPLEAPVGTPSGDWSSVPPKEFRAGRPKGAKNKAAMRYGAAMSWKRATLAYKLKPAQKVIYDTLRGIKDRGLLHCSRRFGKSYLLLLIAVEEALKNPDTQISFICPTQRNLKTYIKP